MGNIMASGIQKPANLVFEDTRDIFTLHPRAEYSLNRLYSYPAGKDGAAIYGNLIMLREKAECCSFNWSALVHKCCNAMSSITVYFFFPPPFPARNVISLLEDDSYSGQRGKKKIISMSFSKSSAKVWFEWIPYSRVASVCDVALRSSPPFLIYLLRTEIQKEISAGARLCMAGNP